MESAEEDILPDPNRGTPGAAIARRRAVLKLRNGFALSDDELLAILPEWRAPALEVKPRSLRQVARLMGVSKERIRQLEGMAIALLVQPQNE